MTPQTFLPRHEWLHPDMNDSPEFLIPSLKLCSGVTLCMSLHCWLVGHNHGSYIHYYSLAKSDNLFARLLSTMIHQHPSSYNVRIFWCKCIWCPRLFLSVLEEWCRYRRVVPVPGGVTAALGANVLGVTHDGESFTPLTPDIVEIVRKPVQ